LTIWDANLRSKISCMRPLQVLVLTIKMVCINPSYPTIRFRMLCTPTIGCAGDIDSSMDFKQFTDQLNCSNFLQSRMCKLWLLQTKTHRLERIKGVNKSHQRRKKTLHKVETPRFSLNGHTIYRIVKFDHYLHTVNIWHFEKKS